MLRSLRHVATAVLIAIRGLYVSVGMATCLTWILLLTLLGASNTDLNVRFIDSSLLLG